jgi:mediator of replication checkpoint protein 1
MASPRPASPTGDALPSASPQLTPRSKLQAELAALDASSDDENTGPIERKLLFKPAAKVATGSTKKQKPSQAQHHGSEAEDHDDEEDENESIARPRGRLAARMQGGEQKSPVHNKVSTRKPTDTTKESTDARVENADAADDGNDDEDQVHNAPRRRRVRAARSTTPEASANKDDGSESEGLFVPFNASHHSAAGSDSDELPTNIAQSSRFQALVARKREERLAREAEEKQKRDERAKRMAEEFAGDEDDGDVSDITDDDGGRQLTQKASRPSARKASKKAQEEMNRETQRLSRSMQLAHEAKTKKKINKSALFERFNFKPAGSDTPAEAPAMSSSRPATPVSAALTDAEMAEASTPPSSPPSVLKKAADPTTTNTEAPELQDDTAEKSQDGEVSQAKVDKGKGKATPADLESPKKNPIKPKRQFRVKFPAISANLVTIDDGDDELQIAKPKKQTKIDAIFNRVPQKKAKDAQPAQTLPHMAHLASPPQNSRGKNQKPSMTVGELQLTLQQRARAQAKLERERRLEMLRAKGIHVQTEEERQKERDEVEDIVARARQEAEEIMAREREDAKKEKKERRKNGEDGDELDWDDSDDDSFADSEGELQPIEEGELEFSGSDEEDEDEERADNESAPNPMFDEDAEEADASDGEKTPRAVSAAEDVDEEEDMDVMQPSKSKSRRRRGHAQVLSDDEEDRVDVEATPKPKTTFPKSPSAADSGSPNVPTSVLRSATKTFIPGLSVPNAAPAGLGLTQIFAGTMDDSQAASTAPGSGSPVEFMPSFDNFPDSQFSATAGNSQPQNSVLDSQTETQKESQGVQLDFEQSQMHGFDSLMQQVGGSQMSDMLNPTQDAGYADFSPLKQRFIDAPQSTVDTVPLHQGSPAGGRHDDEDDHMAESPLVRRQGKLRRRGEAADNSTLPPTAIPGSPLANTKLPPTAAASKQQVEGSAAAEEDEEDDGVSAFRLMAKAARQRRRREKFDKKKSKAKDMVHGEAEESEDEYAGLGGADGEDSSDDEDLEELRKQMIDDAKGNDGDEAKLAAFFA